MTYTALTTPRRLLLTAAMLSAIATAPVSGIDSQVAKITVPDGSMLTLVHDQPMLMYLQARRQMGRQAGVAGSNVTTTVQISGEGRKLLRTTRKAPAFPTQLHPDVRAFVQIANGPWVPADVLAVDWVAGTVDVQTPNNAGQVRVYYTFGDGEVALHAGRPFGSSSGLVQIYRNSARALHESNQADRDTAEFATVQPLPIPQNFSFYITIRAASQVFFDGLAGHEIAIPMSETAIQVSDPVALAELGERQLKGV